jgi:hypothetical protein
MGGEFLMLKHSNATKAAATHNQPTRKNNKTKKNKKTRRTPTVLK